MVVLAWAVTTRATGSAVATDAGVAISSARDLGELAGFAGDMLQARKPDECEILI